MKKNYLMLTVLLLLNLNLRAQQLVKDINPGGNSSYITLSKAVNNTLYFAADEGVTGNELWKSDGTDSGTMLVKDINPDGDGLNYTFPNVFANIDDTLYFVAYTPTSGVELWKTDGTADGTVMVKDIDPGTGSGIDVTRCELVPMNGILYFIADDGVTQNELWRSDGTAEGTYLIKNIAPVWQSYIEELTVVNDILFFSANSESGGAELWKTDGTTSGTVMVKNIQASGGSSPQFLNNVNGTLFFAAYTTEHGKELWKSDGTAEGTVLVKDIRPGIDNSIQYTNVNNFANNNGILYFTATDGVNGIELWKSDGTEEGTVLVKDVKPGAAGGLDLNNIRNFIAINGTLYFMGDNGVSGRELWKSDGTPEGTLMVKDIRAGSSWSEPEGFVSYNNTLYFSAYDGINGGHKLWKSDGTTEGTTIIDTEAPTDPKNITIMNDNLYCRAWDNEYGEELRRLNLSTLGLENENKRITFSLLPNPSTGIVTIITDHVESDKLDIAVFSILGNTVYKGSASKEQMQINLSFLSKGVYIIKVQDGAKVHNQKIIIE
ncbi:T9SS type A sorting domain-containing protein [Flavobacterium sp. GA093]|uniref:T9SS type A sorting domain-containing protein n=1 Tax=Flavobacterium hydrocarbonoxydans TaxID=2683249 RepID=A0A6I4NIA4_9FLAO|nr:ELWxxDGT repeat protein [Flavobacterium hydrocarbonoxydans]MWB93683.1 T9SS type A sorting domain-containing protein [Flavobacterium hydrocarbonoxydans]